MGRFRLSLLAVWLIMLSSCDSDTTSRYANLRAFFRFSPVSSVPVLQQALYNPGTYCKITFSSQYYIFTNAQGQTSQANRTALDAYGKPIYVSGFVVGLSSQTDANGQFVAQAFDLVCPNCYTDAAIQRALDFSGSDSEMLLCGRCHRSYNLRSEGIVASGSQGRPLFAYHISVAENSVFISN